MQPSALLPKNDQPFITEPLNDYLQPGRRFYRINSSYRLFLLKVLREVIQNHVVGKDYRTLVDYGCGQMPYKSLFAPYVESYIGVDIEGNPWADITILPGQSVPLDDGSVDVVLSTQVLEHVLDVEGYLNECVRLLRTGGCLILSTHGIYNWHPSPLDLRRWTWQGLEYEMEQVGLQVIDILPVGGPLCVAANIVARFASDCVPKIRIIRPMILLPLYTAVNLFMRIAEPLTPMRAKYFNCYILVLIARKP